jgi:hypothetical protein
MCDCDRKCESCKCDEGKCSIEVEEVCWACGKTGADVRENICDECDAAAKQVIKEMLLASKKGDYVKVQELLVKHTKMRKRLAPTAAGT